MLIDQPAREDLLRHFRKTGRNRDIEFHARWNPRTQRVITTFLNTAAAESWAMTIRFYTPAQFCHLFRAVGLTVERCYCDLAAHDYHSGARCLYVLGRKPR